MKAIANAETKQILGASISGVGSGEAIHSIEARSIQAYPILHRVVADSPESLTIPTFLTAPVI